MRGAGVAAGVDEGIVGRGVAWIGIAEAAHADAGQRLRADHRRRRAPDAHAAGTGLVDGLFGAVQHEQAALDARVEPQRAMPCGRKQRGRGECERGARPQEAACVARVSPQHCQQHDRVGEPGRARTGQQDRQRQQRHGNREAASTATGTRGQQHERRQHREGRAELEVAGAEHARDAFALGGAAQAPARQCLQPGIERPQRDDHAGTGQQARPLRGVTQRPGDEHGERQEAQRDRNGGPGLGWRHGRRGRQQSRHPITGEQRGREPYRRRAPIDAPTQAEHEARTSHQHERQFRSAPDRQQQQRRQHEQQGPRAAQSGDQGVQGGFRGEGWRIVRRARQPPRAGFRPPIRRRERAWPPACRPGGSF